MPVYIINNSIFLLFNIVVCAYLLKRNYEVKNVELYDYQKLVVLTIFSYEILFAFALYFWWKSGMDVEAWTKPIQQIIYIMAENGKSIMNAFLLVVTMISIRRNLK